MLISANNTRYNAQAYSTITSAQLPVSVLAAMHMIIKIMVLITAWILFFMLFSRIQIFNKLFKVYQVLLSGLYKDYLFL